MKQLILFFAIIISLSSCQDPGTTIKSAGMDDKLLPEELKGLQVYRVYYDEGGVSCLVAVLDNKVNSITYPKGKSRESLLLVQK